MWCSLPRCWCVPTVKESLLNSSDKGAGLPFLLVDKLNSLGTVVFLFAHWNAPTSPLLANIFLSKGRALNLNRSSLQPSGFLSTLLRCLAWLDVHAGTFDTTLSCCLLARWWPVARSGWTTFLVEGTCAVEADGAACCFNCFELVGTDLRTLDLSALSFVANSGSLGIVIFNLVGAVGWSTLRFITFCSVHKKLPSIKFEGEPEN